MPQPGLYVPLIWLHLMLNNLCTISPPGEGPPIDDGYIEPSKPIEEIRSEPYPLLKDFEWSILDISDSKQVYILFIMSNCLMTISSQCKEVYDLLSANYVEDEGASFRFQYSAEFLQW